MLGTLEIDVRNAKELIPAAHQQCLKNVMQEQFKKYSLSPHQADHDALALSLAVYCLQAP